MLQPKQGHRRGDARRIVPVIAVLLSLLGGAGPLPAASWHPLKAGSVRPFPASLAVTSADATGLSLRADFPGFQLNSKTHPYAGAYVAPETPGCGVTEPVGAPALPTLRRLIVAPPDAALRLSVTGSPRFYTLGNARQLFFPRQRPRVKANSSKLIPFDFDIAAYSANAFYPGSPCRLTEAGTLSGRRLVLVEVFPFAVNPVTLGLKVFPSLAVRIDFEDGGKAAKTMPDPLSAHQLTTLADVAVNAGPEPDRAMKGATPRLLLLAPDAWLAILAPLVAQRQAQGWTVDLFGTTATGDTPAAIRAFVKARYDVLDTRPDALLLVGDTPQIPCFRGTRADRPDTDLYYACMDGNGDWAPEFPVGRLSVATADSLVQVLAKLLAYETTPPDLWMSQLVFMASKDNHTITEGTHNAVITAWLDPIGYRSDKLYCASRSATPAQVKSAFNGGRILGVYSGHGDTTYWADGPVFRKSDVLALTNKNRYPVVLSFACLTGKFSLDECFAETWLRAPEKGAAAMLASSVTSYWDEDDAFERALFEAVYSEGIRPLGDAILRAKFKLIETYGLSDTVRRYFEQYNCFGDPATPLREPSLGIVTPEELPTAQRNEPYSMPLQAIGGAKPYAWSLLAPPPGGLSLDSASGVLSGTPLEGTTNHVFTVGLTDAALAATTRTFRIHVASAPLEITGGTNAGPFKAGQTFAQALTAKGGIAPYRWRFPRNGQYVARRQDKRWVWTGPRHSTRWSGDEKSWKVRLPWPFPYYGKNRRRLWINSNGYLDFESRISQWDNSAATLLRHPRIAPLWDDLRTTNVSIRLSTTRLVVRWRGSTFISRTPVDFEAILMKNGTIFFAYKAIQGKLSPTIGISAGDGTNITLASVNNAPDIPGGLAIKIKWTPTVPQTVTLDSGGLLSGTVAAPLLRRVPILVEDSSVPAQTATSRLTLQVE